MLFIQDTEPANEKEAEKQRLLDEATSVVMETRVITLPDDLQYLKKPTRTLMLLTQNAEELRHYQSYFISLAVLDSGIVVSFLAVLLANWLFFPDYWLSFMAEHVVVLSAIVAVLLMLVLYAIFRLIRLFLDHSLYKSQLGPNISYMTRMVMTENLLIAPQGYENNMAIMMGYPYQKGYRFLLFPSLVGRQDFLFRLKFHKGSTPIAAILKVVRPSGDVLYTPCCFASLSEIITMNDYLNKKGLLAPPEIMEDLK